MFWIFSRFFRGMVGLVLLVTMMILPSCYYFQKPPDNNKMQEMTLLVVLGLAYFGNPCNFAASPISSSAVSSSALPANYASVKGRLLTTTGQPVVNALVVLDEATSVSDQYYYSSHSAVNRDGSFVIAGFPFGAGFPVASPQFRLSVEPIHTSMYQRIDTHIDCFMSPANFTAGWYKGAGNSIISTVGSATAITGFSTNEVRDLGTIYVP